MSLIGVRDISVIETPQIERVPCEVQVVEYSDTIVKSAILREMSRGGQTLIIYNRVESIYQFASYISNMLEGSAVVSVAHGQMTDLELETEILNLYSGKTQVLVSTTLIENGVDLPNANTLIVINSDMLGLSQLYQLKGRIGRSDRESFAYFTFDSRKMLTENAYKRLQAIQEFSGMGSGFKIALRDLEIRGAGSLLGLEQSGHIEKIGYNLYVQLLNESVKELRNEKVNKHTDVRVETNLSAYLSHNYVTSSSSRMRLYRDIARIDEMEKMIDFIKNTESIYGDMPIDFVNLIKIAYIKNMCSTIGVTKISIKDKTVIYLENKESLSKNLIDISLDNYKEYININVSGIPTIEIIGIKSTEILEFLINYLQLIIKN
jgi:transcription-repair coupling factor (superfamily II helicase)